MTDRIDHCFDHRGNLTILEELEDDRDILYYCAGCGISRAWDKALIEDCQCGEWRQLSFEYNIKEFTKQEAERVANNTMLNI